MNDTKIGPDNVGRTIILRGGKTIITELAFQNEFTFDDLDEIQQDIEQQKERVEELRAYIDTLTKKNIAQKKAILNLLEFQSWLQDEFKNPTVHRFI